MSEPKNIYCISGLGADRHIFDRLTIPPGYKLEHLPWISPLKGEEIESYAHRMADRINQPDPLLMGVSFGGMISIEISKFLPVKKIILISSIKNKNEMPFFFKVAGGLHLNRIVSLRPYRFLEPIENFTLGAKTPQDKLLARNYRAQLDLQYSDWAIDRILHWKNEQFPQGLVHIHGSADHVFPIRYIHPTHVIKGGGHLMIMNRANEVSEILSRELSQASVYS